MLFSLQNPPENFYNLDVNSIKQTLLRESNTLTRISEPTNSIKVVITSNVTSKVTGEPLIIPRYVYAEIYSEHYLKNNYKGFNSDKVKKQMALMSAITTQGKEDEAGHLIASSLGGPGGICFYNMVPQSKYSNRLPGYSGYRTILQQWNEDEGVIRDFVKQKCGHVKMTVIPVYTDTGIFKYRPRSIRMIANFYSNDGLIVDQIDFFAQNPKPGEQALDAFANLPKRPKNRACPRRTG